jgi:lactate dehydrogenase-like 2-hydroxyacid dehydrogenase
MPDKVLIYSRFPKALMQRIGERFELFDAAGKPPNEVFPADQLAGIRAMITAGGTPLGRDVMGLMPNLGAIICYGTGYDGVDLAAAAKRRITVAHSPGANAASVADIAVTLMLAATRRLPVADQYVRSGDWAAAKPSPMMRPQAGMCGRKVGVYGMGEIGRKIAARVAAFETEVGYFSRTRYDLPYQYRQRRYPEEARQGRPRRQHLPRLGDRSGRAGFGPVRSNHRRCRPRRLRAGAASA